MDFTFFLSKAGKGLVQDGDDSLDILFFILEVVAIELAVPPLSTSLPA
jgi:hypothetical protein